MQAFAYLILGSWPWLRQCKAWYRQIQKRVALLFNGTLKDDLDSFDSLQACDNGCRGCQRSHNAPGFQLNLQPLHCAKMIVSGAEVSGAEDELHMPIAIIILLEDFWLHLLEQEVDIFDFQQAVELLCHLLLFLLLSLGLRCLFFSGLLYLDAVLFDGLPYLYRLLVFELEGLELHPRHNVLQLFDARLLTLQSPNFGQQLSEGEHKPPVKLVLF